MLNLLFIYLSKLVAIRWKILIIIFFFNCSMLLTKWDFENKYFVIGMK